MYKFFSYNIIMEPVLLYKHNYIILSYIFIYIISRIIKFVYVQTTYSDTTVTKYVSTLTFTMHINKSEHISLQNLKKKNKLKHQNY